MVKLELYRVFREVAEAGNISLAAENLYLSQSAVSQSVKQLEQQLGTRLFLRSPRGVTLTEDGLLLFEYVRSAMGLLETGEDKLQQSSEEDRKMIPEQVKMYHTYNDLVREGDYYRIASYRENHYFD